MSDEYTIREKLVKQKFYCLIRDNELKRIDDERKKAAEPNSFSTTSQLTESTLNIPNLTGVSDLSSLEKTPASLHDSSDESGTPLLSPTEAKQSLDKTKIVIRQDGKEEKICPLCGLSFIQGFKSHHPSRTQCCACREKFGTENVLIQHMSGPLHQDILDANVERIKRIRKLRADPSDDSGNPAKKKTKTTKKNQK